MGRLEPKEGVEVKDVMATLAIVVLGVAILLVAFSTVFAIRDLQRRVGTIETKVK